MENLKELRNKYGISQMDFAKIIGVSLPTYILWERGVSNPNDENRVKLETAINKLKEA